MNLNNLSDHEKANWCRDPRNVYVGRAHRIFGSSSRYANPYKIGPHTREEAVKLYELNVLPEFSQSEIEFLVNKQVRCFCWPKLCHATVLLKAVANLGT